ncbi:hypothetical protein AB4144_42200, partial [Rhizobiaceae sp. 2RAB30]
PLNKVREWFNGSSGSRIGTIRLCNIGMAVKIKKNEQRGTQEGRAARAGTGVYPRVSPSGTISSRPKT